MLKVMLIPQRALWKRREFLDSLMISSLMDWSLLAFHFTVVSICLFGFILTHNVFAVYLSYTVSFF